MTEQVASILDEEVRVVNLGVELFAESLKQQGVQVIQIAWEPPAQGDEELILILNQLL